MVEAQGKMHPELLSANILVVTKERSLHDQILNALANAGFENAVGVDDGQLAIQFLRRQSIQLLISEIDLDEFDGWRLSRLVRSGVLACPADLPVFLVSSIWCERIAEVTGREYRIDQLVALEQIDQIPKLAAEYLDVKRPVYSQKLSLLVVEDQKDTSDLIKRVLDTNFEIDEAFNGRDGLDSWIEKKHDLVLLDVMLPELSGHQVLEKIMEIDRNQAVVVMTAHASGELAEKLMLEGRFRFSR